MGEVQAVVHAEANEDRRADGLDDTEVVPQEAQEAARQHANHQEDGEAHVKRQAQVLGEAAHGEQGAEHGEREG